MSFHRLDHVHCSVMHCYVGSISEELPSSVQAQAQLEAELAQTPPPPVKVYLTSKLQLVVIKAQS